MLGLIQKQGWRAPAFVGINSKEKIIVFRRQLKCFVL